jgi:hypothetical protein
MQKDTGLPGGADAAGADTGLAQLLIRLGRMAAKAGGAAEIEGCLLDVVLDPAGGAAAAAAVVRVDGDGHCRIGLARGLPPHLGSWSSAGAVVGPGLGHTLRNAWAAPDPRDVITVPLASGRHVFGALVVFAGPGEALTAAQTDLCQGLCDWVAAGLDRVAEQVAVSRALLELRGAGASVVKAQAEQASAAIAAELDEVLAPLALQTELLRRRLQGQPMALEIVEYMEQSLLSAGALIARLRPSEVE